MLQTNDMTPIIFDTEWLLEWYSRTGNGLWIKVRKYLWDKQFNVSYTPVPGMSVSLRTFLDDSFSEIEKDEVTSHYFIIEDACIQIDCILIFLEAERVIPERNIPNPEDS